MRILVILASTLVLSAIGFVVYWTMAGNDGAHAAANPRAGAKHPASMPTSEGFGPGEHVWWTRYDPKGERTSRIRVSKYKPLKDGRFFVNDPECDFFLHNGQVMHIEGKSGYIVTQENLGKNKNGPAGQNRSPRSGDLKDVTLRVYENEAMNKPPMMTMTMNNASFDNETFRIQTEDFDDAHGRRIPGDRVPVQMVGDSDHPDFDGLGLKLQYNEVDRRLDYLKVFHGQRLLIKHPGNFRQQKPPPTPLPAPATRPIAMIFTPTLPIPGIQLAAADKSAVREAVPRRGRPVPQPATRPKEETFSPVYRAVFKDNVVVTQVDQRLAAADELDVDFISESNDLMAGGPTTQPTTQASTQPTTRPTRAARTRVGPAVPDKSNDARPAKASGTAGPTTRAVAMATTRPTSNSTTKPTTNPSDLPMEITWSGPLVITPVLGDRPDRIAPGEAIVKLRAHDGKFVELNREANGIKSNIKAGTITHWTIDQGAHIEEGMGVPVEMTDSRGTHIITRDMHFSQADGTAVLYGKSHAELPADDASQKTLPPGAKPEMINVDWLDNCTLRFEGDDPDSLIINRAELLGSVNVKTRQIDMTSNALNLDFEHPPTEQPAPAAPTTKPSRTNPALRQLEAFGNVKSIMRGPGGDADIRTLDCENLKLRTAKAPDGHLYARDVDALGRVHTKDPKSELTAGRLHAVMGVPTTQPTTKPTTRATKKADMDAGDLESLYAYDDVHALMDDGSTAEAVSLEIQVIDGKKSITLQGQPAMVTRKNGKLIGNIIHIVPDSEQLSVTGAGRMDGVQRPDPNQPGRPVTVTWEKNLLGHDNVIECIGGVIVNSIGSDGSKDIAKARQVIMTTTRPTTLPTTKPTATQPALASSKKPTSRPSDFDVMGDREIETLVLDGSADVTSTLLDAKGAVIQMRHLDGERMEFYQNDPKAKRFVVPVPGRMLTIDNRAPTTQAVDDSDPMSMRGALAFKWDQNLIYEEAKQKVFMNGNVLVVRQDPGASGKMILTGDRLTADVEPPPQSSTKPTTAPVARGTPGVPSKLTLKKVHVEGNVDVVNGPMHVRAESMDYDPTTHQVTARGSARRRVQKINDNDQEEASFDELIYDTVKGKIISSTNMIVNQRK
jgi:lipopolysaccharide export system protein LptA